MPWALAGPVAEGLAAEELPEEYLAGIRLFNAGEYYDAHEKWEERWQEIGDSSADYWKALIQAAVALLHWERGNVHGARKLYRTMRAYMQPYAPRFMRLDVDGFLEMLAAYFEPLHAAAERKEPIPKPEAETRPRIVLEPAAES